jgi:hypothetical protein
MNNIKAYSLPFVIMAIAAMLVSSAVAHPSPAAWGMAVWSFGAALILGMFMSKVS